MKRITWDADKNTKLKAQGRPGFERVEESLAAEAPKAILENKAAYPGQKIYVVMIDGYANAVPFKETDTEIELITMWPDRKLNKKYGGKKDE